MGSMLDGQHGGGETEEPVSLLYDYGARRITLWWTGSIELSLAMLYQ